MYRASTRSFGHLAFCMGEGTECGLAGQPGRLQQDLTSQSLPWGSSTGNAAGEVEFLARGTAADPAPTRRSLIERRISASQHRGKVRHAVLARSQHRRDRRKTSMVRGRAMDHTMFSAHELFSERRKGFSELPKVFSESPTF